jgi:RNA polymerase sigma-70 factor (ECF subfamily)
MKHNDLQHDLVNLGGGAHALAIQILGNSDDAADAVHDAFAKVLARPDAFDVRKGPLKPWFLRVVRNHCLDLVRRRHAGGPATEELVDPALQPDRCLEREQRDEQLHRALAEVSAERRQILVLRDYLDLSYAEIADVLQIAPGTVMSRLHRARLALKEVLNAYDE